MYRLAIVYRPRLGLSIALLATLAGCGGDAAPAAAQPDAESVLESDLDYRSVAGALVARLELRSGERVLIAAVPGRFDPLVPLIRAAVREAGAEDLGAIAVEGNPRIAWPTEFTELLDETRTQRLPYEMEDVDVAIMMPGAGTGHAVYAAMQDVLRAGHGRTVHFHWLGAYEIDGSERAVDATVDALYQRVLTETDYTALASAQLGFEEAMRGAVVRVTTPAGTDLSFRIGDRPVTKQDGNASAARAAQGKNLIDREIELPAGAIRVAPIESSVTGTIAFPATVWGGQSVGGLVLTLEAGRVVRERATTGLEAARAEMDEAGPAGRAFREFALGFNPLLAIPTEGDRWIPYYGYGAGVVRLSLGDNTELGGAVDGGYVRWNFFIDATVTVDGVTWVQEGRLVR